MENRYAAIRKIAASRPEYAEARNDGFRALCGSFGCHVFSVAVMRSQLSPKTYQRLRRAIDRGERLDIAIAAEVAEAMKSWAIKHGATHYAHVFYPLTGLTAEKHDTFLTPDSEGGALADFSAHQLVSGEADGASLPSGGLRATFEARGHTSWDATSPAYILESAGCRTLFIPSAFCASTGDALDKKTPLLRSLQALDHHARRVLKVLGEEVDKVFACAGCEQEYFLVDRTLAMLRPDLISAGRTLYGAKPPKGQELEDQYYGAVNERVLAFMVECEAELFKLGIPVKTRHNEVAPGQFEIAPSHEHANIASDHQHLVMAVLQRTAIRHGFMCLLHEKPFQGVNGSGKHVNWSINTAHDNLLAMGGTPEGNLRFMLFCAAVIRAISLHSGLLRAAVAHAGNDHRLGACEAPPAIISIFLGEPLTEFFEQLSRGEPMDLAHVEKPMPLGVNTLLPLSSGDGDRNRTSPFAFAGTKFEFRAVGASQSVAGPIMVLNTIVADSLDYLATELESRIGDDRSRLDEIVRTLVGEVWKEHRHIVFNGDNYTAEWQTEAARRELLILRSAPQALAQYVTEESIRVMTRQAVLSERELRARYEIYLSRYLHDLTVEARLTLEIGRTLILPAASVAQARLATTALRLKELGMPTATAILAEISTLVVDLEKELGGLARFDLENGCATEVEGMERQVREYMEKLLPQMERVRAVADALEGLVDDALWPLPTYQEMLFVR